MIKSLIFLTITLVFISPLFSQNDQKEGVLIKFDSLSIENNYGLYQRKANKSLILPKLKIIIIDFKTDDSYFLDLNTSIQNKILPIDTNYHFLLQPKIFRNQPLMNDFNKSRTNRIFNRFYIYSGSRQVTHIAYGEYFQISEALRWIPNNRLSFDVGGFFCRQYNYFTTLRSDILGVNAQTRYALTNKIQFNIWGQYTAPSQQNFFYGNSLFPNSGIGSSLLFKLQNKTQLDMGVKYRYYENKMSWNLESVGRISVGF